MEAKTKIEMILKALKLQYVTEMVAIPGRKYRFDWALPEPYKIAIEYEGVYTTGKSRHTQTSGYTEDCRKYNLAVLNGWRVLRYTAKNVDELYDDLIKLTKQGNGRIES